MTDLKKYEPLYLKNTKDLAMELQKILKILEGQKFSVETLIEALRLSHVIKGSAAMMGLNVLSELFASGEEFFKKIIDQETEIEIETISRIDGNCRRIIASRSFQDLRKQFENVTT